VQRAEKREKIKTASPSTDPTNSADHVPQTDTP